MMLSSNSLEAHTNTTVLILCWGGGVGVWVGGWAGDWAWWADGRVGSGGWAGGRVGGWMVVGCVMGGWWVGQNIHSNQKPSRVVLSGHPVPTQ